MTATVTSTDKAPKTESKPPIRYVQMVRALYVDGVAERLGTDAMTLAVFLIDLMDQCWWRPVGLYMPQLCGPCGFPISNPRRARAARAALMADGWLQCTIPKNGDRAQAVYEMVMKTINQDPGQNGSGKQLTPNQNGWGEDATPAKSVASPQPNRYPTPAKTVVDPSQFGTPSIPTYPLHTPTSTSNTKIPLNPPEGGMGESDDSLELSAVEHSGKPKNRKAKKSLTLDDVRQVVIPQSLNNANFIKAWSDWLSHLDQKRNIPTILAATRQLAKCESLGHIEAIRWIDHAIEHNWRGLFPPDGNVVKKDLLAGCRDFAASVPARPFMPSAEEAERFYNPHAVDGGATEMRAYRELQNKGIRT